MRLGKSVTHFYTQSRCFAWTYFILSNPFILETRIFASRLFEESFGGLGIGLKTQRLNLGPDIYGKDLNRKVST